MEEKEVEKRLKESAENIEVRDFSEVWEEIEHKVQPPKKQRIRSRARFAAGISAAFCVIICAVFIPLYFNLAPERSDNNQSTESPEHIYLEDELYISAIDSEDFFSRLSASDINVVNISDDYIISFSYLFLSSDQKVLGGMVELTDDVNNPTFFLAVQLYHQSVQSSRPTVDYDYNYTVEGTVIEYRVKEAYPEEGVYIYDIKAKYLQTNYYMEYTCFSEDITSFLTDFFTE